MVKQTHEEFVKDAKRKIQNSAKLRKSDLLKVHMIDHAEFIKDAKQKIENSENKRKNALLKVQSKEKI